MIRRGAPGLRPSYVEPLPGSGVMVIGDLHMGRGANATAHAASVNFDLPRLATPDVVVQVGDMTEDGTTAEDTLAVNVLNAVPGLVKRTLVGNHDDETLRGGAAAQASWGYNALNWSYDAGFALLIGVSPANHPVPGGNGSDPTITLDATALSYLDTTLATATKDCWIFCHAPLDDPVMGATGQWAVQPSSTVLGILAARTRAKAWISGHTHTDPYLYPNNIAKSYDVGGRNVAQINVSAIAYVNPNDDLYDPVRVFYLTPGTNAVDARIRDCRQGRFVPWPEETYVRSVAFS